MSGPTPSDTATPVIDFGAHLYPESVFPDEVYRDSPLRERLGARMSDPDRLLSLYERAGIDRAVLSQPFYIGSGDRTATERANDALLDVVESHEEFYGLAAVPTAAGGAAAADELERCLANGYHGAAIETRSDGIELTDRALEPVFAAASSHDAPVLVHPKLNDTLHPDVLDDKYVLNAIFGREVGLAESICKVIQEGVLDQFPDLTLVYHHYGGNIASMLGRVHLQLDEGRWPGRQEHVKPYSEFKTQLDERIFIDTSGFFGYRTPLRAALEELPASQVLFGTDYPFEGRSAEELQSYAETVRETRSDTDAPGILGRNAIGLLVNAA